MFRKTVAALAAVGALVCASRASAAVMVATYAGSTNGFQDTTGIFGFADDPNGNFHTYGWEASFTFESDSAHLFGVDGQETMDVLGVAFSLNGYTVQFGGSGFARRNGFGQFQNFQDDGSFRLVMGMLDHTPGDPATTAFALDQTGSALGNGECLRGAFSGGGAAGSLCPNSIIVRRAQADLPEPAAWTLMLMGFTALGLALRSRPRVAVRT